MPLSMPLSQWSNQRICRLLDAGGDARRARPERQIAEVLVELAVAPRADDQLLEAPGRASSPAWREPAKFSVVFVHHGSYQPPMLQTGTSTSVTRAIRFRGRFVATYESSHASYSGETWWMNGRPPRNGTASHAVRRSFERRLGVGQQRADVLPVRGSLVERVDALADHP